MIEPFEKQRISPPKPFVSPASDIIVLYFKFCTILGAIPFELKVVNGQVQIRRPLFRKVSLFQAKQTLSNDQYVRALTYSIAIIY
jgi:hypothetical protein